MKIRNGQMLAAVADHDLPLFRHPGEIAAQRPGSVNGVSDPEVPAHADLSPAIDEVAQLAETSAAWRIRLFGCVFGV